MIDLHCHTVYSDGSDTPAALIQKAEKIGLTVLSITDHNAIGAYEDPGFREALDSFHGILIPGIEVTCMFEGEVVEVLGYGYDLEKMKKILPDHVLTFEDKQKKEYDLILQAMRKAGARLDPEKIVYDPKKESSRKAFLNELNRHSENASLFLDPESRTRSRIFTRKEIYNPESPLYVDEQSLYPAVKEAADMIHEAGGIALLAHLYEYASADLLYQRMEELIRDNHLDGLECRHSCFTREQAERLETFCDTHSLLKSGGSDYHGLRKPDVILGNKADMLVPESFIDSWPEKIRKDAM